MSFGKRFLSLAILLTIAWSVPADAGYKRINKPNPKDPMSVHIYELDNGLTVYLTENHEKPRFYAEISVRAGSNHDPAESTGLAHYLEHLLFKGTQKIGTLDYAKEHQHIKNIEALYEKHFSETDAEKRKEIYAEINKEAQLAAEYSIPNELDNLYKSMGGTGVNAHTWFEETVYKVDLPANRINQWAEIESERFVDPVYRLFHTELETVYEEKNRSLDNKDRVIFFAVLETLFKNHPAGQQQTIGSVEHLKNPSLVNIHKFFNTYYVPNNMAITISGDIDNAEAIKLIDQKFSGWKRKDLPKLRSWEEDPLKGIERVETKYQGEEYVMLAFRTAARTHEDAEALSLLDMILDNRTAGLINLNLTQSQAVRRAGSSPMMGNDFGFQYLWGIPKEGQTLEEVEKLLLDQTEIIKKGEIEEWILPAIVTDFKKSEKAGLESNSSRVSAMRTAFLSYEDWDHYVASLDRMGKLTKADIVRVAKKYFGENLVAGYRRDAQHEVPKIEKPQIDKIDIDPTRQSPFAMNVRSLPVDEIEPVFVDPKKDYQISTYSDGAKLYYSENPINDLFSLTISVELGTRHEDRMGLAAALLDKSGTGDLTAEDLKKEWYKLGTDFGFGAGEQSTTITISGLDENFDASLALALQLVKTPKADDETLAELKKIVIAQRADSKKNPRTILDALRRYSIWGDQSPHLVKITDAEIEKKTVDELLSLVSGIVGYEQTITYTGSLDPKSVIAKLKTHHPLSKSLKKAPARVYLTARAPEKTEIRIFPKEMAQAQMYIEYGDEVYDESARPSIALFNNYFSGGMAGIVFQELREARALAYSVGARYLTGSRPKEQSRMVGYIGTQTDKTPEAVEAFIELMDDLPESPERFGNAQNALVNQYRTSKVGFREVLGTVRGWEKLGLEPDPRKARYEAVKQSDLSQLLNFHKARIQGRPKLISIVGDTSKIDQERLSKIGKPMIVGMDDIFVK
jgi:predicted Zn-dependent peptidase